LILSPAQQAERFAVLGSRPRNQCELIFAGSLREFVPNEHVLARAHGVLDLSWLRSEVRECYSNDGIGRPGIDPESAVRLMLAGFLLGIVHDRKLMREAQVNLAIRWFAGYGLHDALPDHSSLTRIRQRWGAELFRAIFVRTVRACVAAGIAKGEVVHIDATLIRADVAWESLGERHVQAVLTQNGDGPSSARTDDAAEDAKRRVERNGKQTGRYKKICLTDPDATMATNARNRRLEPAYKQHTAVDDILGVVLDVEVTTGEANEGDHILPQIDAVTATTGNTAKTVTADQGYAYGKVYGGLERRGVDPLIPAKKEPIRAKVPLRRFRYDARHDIVKCLRGKTLRPGKPIEHGRFFHSKSRECGRCDLASICISNGRPTKSVVISDDYPALLRARRRKERWSEADARLYQRHRWRSEGFHGEAKAWHGLARAVRRGLTNMRIQAFLIAAAVNLKRLAAALASMFHTSFCVYPVAFALRRAGLLATVQAQLGDTGAPKANFSTAPACTSCAMPWLMPERHSAASSLLGSEPPSPRMTPKPRASSGDRLPIRPGRASASLRH
jgi:transposase